MKKLCKSVLLAALCWMVLPLIDGAAVQARHRHPAYHRAHRVHRHIHRHAYRHAVPVYRAYPRVNVVAPGVRVHVGPGVRVYAYPGVRVHAGHVYGGYWHGW